MKMRSQTRTPLTTTTTTNREAGMQNISMTMVDGSTRRCTLMKTRSQTRNPRLTPTMMMNHHAWMQTISMTKVNGLTTTW